MGFNVLITGSTGFVGRALLKRLLVDNFNIRAAVRNDSNNKIHEGIEIINVGELNSITQWKKSLEGVDVVVHLAARAHILHDQVGSSGAEYFRINVDATLNLANQAAKAGIKRFIYLSTIKVNGEFTEPGKFFTPDDLPCPQNAYGVSKYKAELGLREIANESGMELVIIRPPLVYGPDVKANFLSLMQLLSRSIPLPFGSINNKRSLVALDNLVDLIVKCSIHPEAANQIFLVSDDDDLSTTDLLCRLGRALEKPPRLFSLPHSWLHLFARLLGFGGEFDRLLNSLCVDISKTRDILSWSPIIGVDEALSKAAENFKKNEKNF